MGSGIDKLVPPMLPSTISFVRSPDLKSFIGLSDTQGYSTLHDSLFSRAFIVSTELEGQEYILSESIAFYV